MDSLNCSFKEKCDSDSAFTVYKHFFLLGTMHTIAVFFGIGVKEAGKLRAVKLVQSILGVSTHISTQIENARRGAYEMARSSVKKARSSVRKASHLHNGNEQSRRDQMALGGSTREEEDQCNPMHDQSEEDPKALRRIQLFKVRKGEANGVR